MALKSAWFVSTPWNNETLVTGAVTATQYSQTRALPKSNFLARIGGTLRATGVAVTNLSLDKFQIGLGGSQTIVNVRGGVLRGVQKYEQGSCKNGTLVSTTDIALPFQYQFGRYLRDTSVIVPGKLYRSVDMTLTFTPTFTTSLVSVVLDLWAEEYISDDDPRTKRIKRLLTIDIRDPAASSTNTIDINPGGLLRGLYLWTADLDNLGANGIAAGGTNGSVLPVRVIGNGSDIPVSLRPDMIDAMLVNTYRFDDAAVPTGIASDAAVATGTQVLYKVADFDLDDSLTYAVDTNRLNRLQVEYITAASGDSGNVETIQEDVIPVIL